KFPDIQKILAGNQEFQRTRNATLIQDLVDNGQKPPVMMISCSDSRLPEASVFNSEPGTFFMQRNIANQYKVGDEGVQSAMAYGINVLGVQHLVVLGHYGCGGVAASIASPPKAPISVSSGIVATWISDIRTLYLSSDREEIVEMRTRNLEIEAQGGTVEEPTIREPGFRALVEENVKLGVQRLAASSVYKNLVGEVETRLNADGTPRSEARRKRETPAQEEAATEEEGATLKPVFIHGWVHDLETGEVIDLNVSVGPPGFENFVPPSNGEGETPTPS
ncbi:carbonic anhydrase, partial [Serendipita vermifera]